MSSPASEIPGGVSLAVRAKPKSSKSRVLGVREGAVEVALAAPPVDGKANSELLRTLADFFGLAPSALTLAHGASGRRKLVQMRGARLSDVEERLSSLAQ